MSNIAFFRDPQYNEATGDRITVADVLNKLKEELAEQHVVLADAKRNVKHLEIAIAAIERDEGETKRRVDTQRPTFKRGHLSRGVIDAIREGIGTASAIVSHLDQRGITTTQASVSNAINRLQSKRQVHFDQMLKRWVVTENAGSLDMAITPTNGANIPVGLN